MLMGPIQRSLTKWTIKKTCKEAPFKKAKYEQNGNLILTRSKILKVCPLIFFILCIVYLGLEIVPNIDNFNDIDYLNRELPSIIFVGIIGIALGIVSIPFLISKVLISDHGITSYGFYRKKHIDFKSITSVEYTRFYGGCAVLKTNKTKLLIPFELYGFYHFYEILEFKLGNEKCMAIGDQLHLRKKELNI